MGSRLTAKRNRESLCGGRLMGKTCPLDRRLALYAGQADLVEGVCSKKSTGGSWTGRMSRVIASSKNWSDN